MGRILYGYASGQHVDFKAVNIDELMKTSNQKANNNKILFAKESRVFIKWG